MDKKTQATHHDLFMEHLQALDDERQEPCFHCGKVWYAIHHKDGLCHNCRQAGFLGRSVVASLARWLSIFSILLALIASICVFTWVGDLTRYFFGANIIAIPSALVAVMVFFPLATALFDFALKKFIGLGTEKEMMFF